jgi:uncharacterized protein (DUF3084 family)
MFMDERPFYEAGYHEVKGLKRIALPVRRLVRRVLRPIFVELNNQFRTLDARRAQLEMELAQLELRQAHLDLCQNQLGQRQKELDHRQKELDHCQNQLYHRQNELDRDSKAAAGNCVAQVDRDLKSFQGLRLDHVAIARRLAVLEDHVEALLSQEAGGAPKPFADEQEQTLIPFPPGQGTHDAGDEAKHRHPAQGQSTNGHAP